MDININITLKNIDIKFSEKEDCLEESAYRQIEDLIDYIVELEEEGEETLSDVMSEFDEVYETQEGFLLKFNQIIKLQARIKTLENTLEYLARRPTNNDGR